MSRTKRTLSLLLALVMVFLVACSPNGSGSSTGKNVEYQDELTMAGNNALASTDYVVTNKNPDHAFNANFIDGLMENDRVGKLVPALAESVEESEDKTEYTFKLKPGIKWVTSNQEEYEDVKAQDFVTGLRHAAEFKSGVNELVQGVIKGYTEYLNSDFSDAEWEKVGIKALDDQTLVYTLEKPTPFFLDFTTYNILLPINQKFLEGQGTGCKLGAPDPENCSFGSTTPDSILYNGAYVLESFDSKSSIVIIKNEQYWDAENVFIKKITEIYDNGEDPYSIKTGFENGTYPSMGLRANWKDYSEIKEQYKEYVRESQPNASVFGVLMNYNRQSFELTQYAQDEAKRENTKNAIQNLNFRKAFQAAFDRTAYLAVNTAESVAKGTLRNVNNFPEAATTKDGKPYYDLVEKEYKELTGEEIVLDDAQDPWLNKDKALEFLAAAEKEGIEFPVHLDYLVLETNDALVKQANSMKQSVEANTDGKIIVELVMAPESTVYNVAFRNEDPAAIDYDISTFSGWGPDYNDPQTFAQTFSTTEGSYMVNVGLGTDPENADIKEKVGFTQYEKLYQEAKNEVDDLDKRYELFAKADAWLIANKLYLPGQMQARGEIVSKLEPLQGPYSQVGLATNKYKGRKLRTELITAEEYQEIRDAWEKEREKEFSE